MKKLPAMQERELHRLPEFGDMPIDARRRAWREVSREMRFEASTILLYSAFALLAGGALFVAARPFIADPGWRGELIWVFYAAIIIPSIFALHVIEVRRIRRRLWSRLSHLCNTCGYNLTGNTSGVCPECGRETHQASNSTGSRGGQ